MKRLFLDTGAFVSKEMASDQYHLPAIRGWREIEAGNFQLVSSEHILDESATLIARRTTYAWAADWGGDVLEADIEWLRAEPGDFQKTLRTMRKFADQKVSFTDCLSAVLMKRAGIKTVFGFDRHFEAMGFRIWPVE